MLPLSLVALAVLVAVHLLADRLRFLDGTPRSRWLSAAGGISLAYVFLHLLPELAEGQALLAEEGLSLAFVEFEVYGLALVGLLAFYGIERMVQEGDGMGREEIAGDADPELRRGENTEAHPAFWLHLATFAIYNLIIGYLLLHRGGHEEGHAENAHGAEGAAEGLSASGGEGAALLTFAVAMALHFLVTDYGLREDFRRGWMRKGRWVLSAAVVAGWALGALVTLPEIWVLCLIAFLGGGVILNVLKEELPEERQSRFVALLAGAGAYAALLSLAH